MYLNISFNLLQSSLCRSIFYFQVEGIAMIDWCSVHFEIHAFYRFLLCTIVLLVFHLFTAIQWHQVNPMAISTHRILLWFAPQLPLVASAKKCKHTRTHTHTSYLPFSHTHTHSQTEKNFDFVLQFLALSRTGFCISANCSQLTVKLKLQPKSPFP